MMKPMDGLTRHVWQRLLEPDPFCRHTAAGFSEKLRVFQALDLGVTEFLLKPFNAQDPYCHIASASSSVRDSSFVSGDFL
jgi:hypothetical protein